MVVGITGTSSWGIKRNGSFLIRGSTGTKFAGRVDDRGILCAGLLEIGVSVAVDSSIGGLAILSVRNRACAFLVGGSNRGLNLEGPLGAVGGGPGVLSTPAFGPVGGLIIGTDTRVCAGDGGLAAFTACSSMRLLFLPP